MFIFCVLQLNSMDKTICYLERLPIELQDRVFFFLTCHRESEAECYERTKYSKKIPLDIYRNYFPEISNHSIKDIAVYSPNRTKIALYQTLGRVSRRQVSKYKPEFVIVDLQKDNKIVYQQQLNAWNYEHIAVSSHATMMAAIYEDESASNENGGNKYLMIKKLTTQKELKFPIDRSVTISSVNFNNQGTSVIVNSVTTQDVFAEGVLMGQYHKKQYTVFSLKKMRNEVNSNKSMCKAESDTRLLLQKYFRKKKICKALQNIQG